MKVKQSMILGASCWGFRK